MRTRLPSTSSLIAFEAVARHSSFTRAAIELNLTQAAISHQVRNIEDLLGTRLFERTAGGVRLTEAAFDYLAVVRAALAQISAASDRISELNDENALTIQCLGTFAIKRLLPILPDFKARYPAISIKLETVQAFQVYQPHRFDVAFWHGTGGWPNVQAERLADEEVFPICSAAFLAQTSLKSLGDLRAEAIIRTASSILSDEWPFWLDHAGLSDIDLDKAMTCDFLVTSIQAAADGLGIALGRSSLVARDLERGLLTEPFSIRTQSQFAYYLVIPTVSAGSRKAEVFRRWFLEAMG